MHNSNGRYAFYTSTYHYAWVFFQSRDSAISFQLTPSIYLSQLRYVIKINSSLETMPKDLQKVNGNYKTAKVKVSHSGKYFYYTTKPY